MFKRGVLVLAAAAMLAMLSGEVEGMTKDVTVETNLKHPVVKSVVRDHNDLKVTLQEDPTKANDDEEDSSDADSEDKVVNLKVDLRKVLGKSGSKVKMIDLYGDDVVRKHKDHDDEDDEDDEDNEDADVDTKKHKKQHDDVSDDSDDKDGSDSDSDSDSDAKTEKPQKHHNHKQISETKKEDGEIVRKYPHGSVRIQAKGASGKKSHKKDAPASAAPKDTKTTTKDVNLESGESVLLDFGGHMLNLTVAKNGSLFVEADNQSYVLPPVDEVEVNIEGAFVLDEGSSSEDKAPVPTENVTTAPSVKKEVKSHVNLAAKKFTDLVTTVTGNTVSKDAAPVVFACGLVGALAAIVGVAAVAIGRARHNAAAEDPQSVLADAAVEDVEAGVQAKTEEGAEDEENEKTEDASAEKSEALSDSESDSEIEEGTFANDDKNTASV